MRLEVKYGQTIFDVALICYQDASRAYDILAENPTIPNINADLTGYIINYTPASVTQKEVIKTITPTKKSVTIGYSQTLFDVALQYYVGAENVYDLIAKNAIENINSNATGVVLNYDVNNTYAPLYYRINNINVATKPLKITENPTLTYSLLTEGDYFLIQENSDKILL